MAGASPSWADIATAVGTCIAAVGVIGVLAAAVSAHTQVREVQKDRRIQTLMEMRRGWSDKVLQDSRAKTREPHSAEELRDILLWLRATDRAQFIQLLRVPEWLNGLGMYVYQGAVPFDVVVTLFGVVVIRNWEWWRPTILAIREVENSQVEARSFQYLAERILDPREWQPMVGRRRPVRAGARRDFERKQEALRAVARDIGVDIPPKRRGPLVTGRCAK